MKPLLIVILAVLAIMNCISFYLMWYDKKCAEKNKWRVPEKTLFLATALFGGLGGTAGMLIFRHKTKHWYFRLFFPLMLVIQAGIVWYVISRFAL